VVLWRTLSPIGPESGGSSYSSEPAAPKPWGTGRTVRRMYAAVVYSLVLYGDPVWASDVAVTRRLRDLLGRLQRRVAIRAVRSYRTVSHAAAMVLAGMPPLDLAVQMYDNMYRRVRGIRNSGAEVTGKIRRVIKDRARRSMILEWQRALEDPNIAGRRTVEAIRPCLPEWIDRVKYEGITCKMTQVLSGHGCFGEYFAGSEKSASRSATTSVIRTTRRSTRWSRASKY